MNIGFYVLFFKRNCYISAKIEGVLSAHSTEQSDTKTSGLAGKFLRLLVKSLNAIPGHTRKNRAELYDRIEIIWKNHFQSSGAKIQEEEYDYQYRLLRTVIRLVERDIRLELDIYKEDYFPDGLDVADQNLFRAMKAREARRLAIQDRELRLAEREAAASSLEISSPSDQLALAHSRNLLAFIDQSAGMAMRLTGPIGRLLTLRALLISELQLVAAEGRIAMLWFLVQPAVLLAIISIVYYFVATSYILNMDVPTFALLGSAAWIMCRQTIFRVSNSFLGKRALFNLPPVRPFDVALTQAVIYLIIYIVVFMLLVAGGHLAGLITLPEQVLPVIFYLMGMWLFAFSLGLIFGSIATILPLFPRFASVIERCLMLFSSVFFVSEQLPEAYKPFVLWCPTAHGMQLMRGAYFPGYDAPDASQVYFAGFVIVFFVFAQICERAVRSRLQPV